MKLRPKRALELEAEAEAVGRHCRKALYRNRNPLNQEEDALTQIQTPASGRAHT